MKSAVETLGPTRVRLTVEVPFDELKPSIDAAYQAISRQVRVAGFRPGKVPPRILDQRVGRSVVLEQAVQEAVPKLYGDALRQNDVAVLGHPDVEVTNFADGDQLVFTAEVDVRPRIELPDYAGLGVTVDDADVTDEDVDAQLGSLRERFAVLSAAGRPAQAGDFVLLDIKATVDGTDVPGAAATGLSYEIGSDSLMPGLDEALAGAAEGETRSFRTELRQGELAGRTAEVSVTARSIKVKDLPELDDEFAQTASEFDTIAELRADVRQRLERVRRLEQGMHARDRVLRALLEQVDVPIPASLLEAEVDWRRRAFERQLASAGLDKEEYLAAESRSAEEVDAELEAGAREAVKTQLVLEAVASKEQLQITEAELADHVVRLARQAGASPDAYAQSVVEGGHLSVVAGEVVRAKALALVLERAVVTDTSGRPVDLRALNTELGDRAAGAEPAERVAAEPDDVPPAGSEPVTAGAASPPSAGS